VPPTPVRELRDLTRYRASLAQEINRIANRIQKVLEDANIKLASVATDTLGASGRAMLEAIIHGEQDSQRLAETVGPSLLCGVQDAADRAGDRGAPGPFSE
jgi:transposase